jgi:hypothetical protein
MSSIVKKHWKPNPTQKQFDKFTNELFRLFQSVNEKVQALIVDESYWNLENETWKAHIEPIPAICFECGSRPKKLHSCSDCRMAWFCGEECHKKLWGRKYYVGEFNEQKKWVSHEILCKDYAQNGLIVNLREMIYKYW